MTIVGVTGTQRELSARQLAWIDHKIRESIIMSQVWTPGVGVTLHHGDCIGADASAHLAALRYNIPVVVHPPVDSSRRAWCGYPAVAGVACEILEVKPYLKRNRAIVAASDLVLAMPLGPETLRSGTWSTVRHAVKVGKPVSICYPDGTEETR